MTDQKTMSFFYAWIRYCCIYYQESSLLWFSSQIIRLLRVMWNYICWHIYESSFATTQKSWFMSVVDSICILINISHSSGGMLNDDWEEELTKVNTRKITFIFRLFKKCRGMWKERKHMKCALFTITHCCQGQRLLFTEIYIFSIEKIFLNRDESTSK